MIELMLINSINELRSKFKINRGTHQDLDKWKILLLCLYYECKKYQYEILNAGIM